MWIIITIFAIPNLLFGYRYLRYVRSKEYKNFLKEYKMRETDSRSENEILNEVFKLT